MFKNIPFKFSKVLGNELGLIKLLFFIIWCICQPLIHCDQIITIPEECLISRKTLGIDDSDILPGHGFDSNKDLWLQAGSVNVPFSIVKAGQWLNMWTLSNPKGKFYVKTYGSHIQAGNGLQISTVGWAGDSRIETEGGILSVPSIEFGRTFNYFGKSICFSTKKVRDDLTRSPDIYGHFINFYEKDVAYPPLTKEEWVINGIWKA